ncbi:hypothetical protein ETR_14281 [Erwinia tracheiphila PSU-1]|nr:hypothetical protein ETR_14281 [Erwinia tracheiphila PSU-1]
MVISPYAVSPPLIHAEFPFALQQQRIGMLLEP